jgi:hypothetical protein
LTICPQVSFFPLGRAQCLEAVQGSLGGGGPLGVQPGASPEQHTLARRAAAVDALESQQQRLLGAFQVARRPRLLFSRTKTRAGPRPAAASPGAAPRALAATGRAARQLPRRGGQS